MLRGTNSRLGNNVRITGADLAAAINAVLAGQQVDTEQKPENRRQRTEDREQRTEDRFLTSDF